MKLLQISSCAAGMLVSRTSCCARQCAAACCSQLFQTFGASSNRNGLHGARKFILAAQGLCVGYIMCLLLSPHYCCLLHTNVLDGVSKKGLLPVSGLGHALVTGCNDTHAALISHLEQATHCTLGIHAVLFLENIHHVFHQHKARLEPVNHLVESCHLAISAQQEDSMLKWVPEGLLLSAKVSHVQICLPKWPTANCHDICNKCRTGRETSRGMTATLMASS